MVSNKSAKGVLPAMARKDKEYVQYHFFSDALPRHPHLDVQFMGHYANRLDVSTIAREYDVALLPQIDDPTQVMALKGIRDESGLVQKSGKRSLVMFNYQIQMPAGRRPG